jgi:hypothetical protein
MFNYIKCYQISNPKYQQIPMLCDENMRRSCIVMDDGSEPSTELCQFSLLPFAFDALLGGSHPMNKINVNEVRIDYNVDYIFVDYAISIHNCWHRYINGYN